MPIVPVEGVKNGMVLARDVKGAGGTVVLAAGTVLTEKYLALLAEAGVARVEVTEESYALADMLLDEAPGGPPAAETTRPRGSVTAARVKGHAITGPGAPPEADAVSKRLLRVARMFAEHKNDPLMRELCRLAIKCVQEGLVSG